jgi:toxin ParE1/3/4
MKTRRLVVREAASEEMEEAAAWYANRSPGLGDEFLRTVKAAMAVALREPELYPVARGRLRRVVLRRFPYSIFFSATDDEVVIVACHHHRRDPRRWHRRR